MNKHLKNYFKSFSFKRKFWEIFAIDFVTISIIYFFFALFANYLNKNMAILTSGQTPEQLQALLSSASPEQLLPFLTQLKSFMLTFLLGIAFLLIISLFLFSFSRALIWNKLHHRKLTKKTYWRWNGLNLALLFPLFLLLLIVVIVKLIFNIIFSKIFVLFPSFAVTHPQFMQIIQLILHNTVNFFLALLLLVVIFFTYYLFTDKYKVWLSIGESFNFVKVKWSRIWRMLLLSLSTAIILTLIILPLRKLLLPYQFTYFIINVCISLFYLAWLRIYLLRTVGHKV
jgi:hypothetical protein